MLNRVGSSKTSLSQLQTDQTGDTAKRPGPSANSLHPTGPAPPFEYGDEPRQTDTQAKAEETARAPLSSRIR